MKFQVGKDTILFRFVCCLTAFVLGLMTPLASAQNTLYPNALFPLPFLAVANDSLDFTFADVNGDGKLDLIILDNGVSGQYTTAPTVDVLLGNGDGTYGAVVSYPCGSGATLKVVDINGDGRPDIFVSNTILLNKGNGTFGAATPLPNVLGSPEVADVNGDGKPDLLSAQGGVVSVQIGNGDGTFRLPVTYPAGNGVNMLVVGDVNGDGKPDVVASDSASIYTLLNKGDGTFGDAKQTSTTFYRANALALADVDGDGKTDIIVANNQYYAYQSTAALTAGTISLLRGNGDGTFQANVDYTVGRAANGLRVADLNGDGKPDIVTASQFGAPTAPNYDYSAYSGVSVLLNRGGGVFTQTDYETQGLSFSYPNSYGASAQQGVGSFLVADPRGVGKPDIFTAKRGSYQTNSVANRPPIFVGGSGISTLINRGDGTFQDRQVYYFNPNAEYGKDAAVADLNGDGKPDLIAALSYRTLSNGYISIRFGNGDGTFGALHDYYLDGNPVRLTIADVNGDGKPDIVAACTYYSGAGSIKIMLNQGNGIFGTPTDYPITNYLSFSNFAKILVTDVNKDGKADLVFAALYYDYMNGGGLYSAGSVLFGQGNGKFSAPVFTSLTPAPQTLRLADINGDGIPDIVYGVTGASAVSVLLGKNDGTFGAPTDYPVSGSFSTYSNLLFLADLNGDGHRDILTSLPNFSALFGNGDGTFQPHRDFANTTLLPDDVFSDVNGDGKADIVGGLQIQLNNGDGTFGAAQPYFGATAYLSESSVKAVVDLNGDGRPDIVALDAYVPSGNQINVYLNQGTAPADVSVSGVLTLEGIVPGAAAQSVTFEFRSVGGGTAITKTATVAPGGAFQISGLPAGKYNAWIKGAKYLASVVAVDASAGSVSGVTAMLSAGDANNDNSCDATDFGLFVNAYNSAASIPGSGYDPACDFNGDGFVDLTDFGLFVGNYNTQGTP